MSEKTISVAGHATRWLLLALALAPVVAAQAPDDTARVGDRILLQVVPGLTDSARQQGDTFTVTPGPAVLLPGIGEVSLAGVPRRGIEAYLTTELARFLKNPVVHARVLVRLGILGEVERPGYYAVPADAVLTDALMAAGGPTRDAKFGKVVIERDAQRLWEGHDLQRAIGQGMTVSQMKLRSGDRIVVPRRRDSATTAQVLSLMLTIPAAIYGLTRLF